MAGTISFVAGAAADVLPPPVGLSAKRSGTQHAENRGVAGRALPGPPIEGLREQPIMDAKGLTSTSTQGQSPGPSHKTSLIFERDENNGKMYLYIRDRRTGEEVLRIPRRILGDAEPQATGNCVDIRV